MPRARNSAALKRPAWMKGVVNSVTFTMNRFARRAVSRRSAPRLNLQTLDTDTTNKCIVSLSDIANLDEGEYVFDTSINQVYTLEENCTLTINNNFRFGGNEFINNGTILVKEEFYIALEGTLSNNDKIIISDNATINTSGGDLENSGSIIIKNEGAILGRGGTLNNSGSIIIESGPNENNFRGIFNLSNGSELNNSGNITNGGTISNRNGETIINENDGIINNSGGTITNNGTFENRGKIYNPVGTTDCPDGTINGNNPIIGTGGIETTCPPP
jgi:hypothetical protein